MRTFPTRSLLTAMSSPLALYHAAAPALEMALTATNAESARKLEPTPKPLQRSNDVAIVPVVGYLTKDPELADWLGGTDTIALTTTLRKLATDPTVKSVMLLIDSPGGSSSGMADAAEAVQRLATEKPTAAYAADLACSAAYWLASQTRRISASRSAIIGSIGTYSWIVDSSGLADRIGFRVHVLSTGTHKGAGVPGAPISEQQLAEMQRVIESLNSHFVGDVARGRRMTAARLAEVTDGRVWIGSEARDVGLVDRIESFEAALAGLESMPVPTAPVAYDNPRETFHRKYQFNRWSRGFAHELALRMIEHDCPGLCEAALAAGYTFP